MARFIVRIQFNNIKKAHGNLYNLLHKAMEGKGFSLTFIDDTDLTEYYLPNAEYYISKRYSSTVIKKAEDAIEEVIENSSKAQLNEKNIKTPKLTASILVTEAIHITSRRLEKPSLSSKIKRLSS